MIISRSKLRHQAGATIVEVLVAIALTGIMLPALATALVAAHAGKATSGQQLQAESLMREGTEAVRSVREKGWSNIATDGTYHPVISGSAWALSAGSETIGSFTRSIVISTPQRNSSGVIVTSGGTNDPSTKHVVVTVSWTTPTNSSIASDAYLTRWQNNTVWTQTTQADFTGGTLTNTCAIATCDVLSAPSNAVQLTDSPATWQLPSVYGSRSIGSGVAANCVFYASISSVPYAFVGYATGMAIVNLSNPAAPTLTGTFATSAAVNDIYVSGTTAYLATSITNAQFKIVNVATPATPTQTGTLQVGDTTAALGLAVSGTNAYVVKQAAAAGANGEFNVVNITNPAAPTNTAHLARIRADMNSIVISGNFAYVATAATSDQLQVVNITTPATPTSAATVNLGVTANDVAINGSTVYLATVNNTTSGELRIYNVTTPTAPVALGSYEIGAAVNGVSIDSSNANYVGLATGVAAKQAIFVNVSTPATPTLVTNLTLSNTASDIMLSGSYAYVADADTTKGLQVIYTGYRPNGTFESSSFDPGANVGYNYITFGATIPGGSTLQLQVAANNTNSGWSYVGPDGTASTFYTTGDSIPLGIVSNRYFRYKVFFTPTANGQQTPALNDVEVNYSP
jgi:type II secretory pathway pseudopilin PulG